MVVLNDLHFHLLEAFVSRVKAGGDETDSDDILAIDGEFISSLSSDIQEPVGSAIQILRILKDLEMILNALRKAVENSLFKAKKELLPATRHHGILSLPPEIIVHVLRQVYDSDADCATESIPLVNRYFRDIAIGTPELWTRLSPCRNPRLFIERSKSLGLEVDLGRGLHYRRSVEMFALEAERWTSLTILTKRDLDKEDFEWTRDVLAGKTFAALRELHIERGDRHYGSLEDLDTLHRGWKLPSLRLLKSKNVLPSIHPASLTGLHLHVGNSPGSSYDMPIDLEEITTFLQTAPLLTELAFDIGWFETISFDTGTNVTLPNVKTLRLGVKIIGDKESFLRDFLASIRTPNVSYLSVDMTTKNNFQLIQWTDDIFPKGNNFWPSLETLDLSMSFGLRTFYTDFDWTRYKTSSPYHLFKIIPAVRHLSIRAVHVLPPQKAYRDVQFPHLRTLCFRDCNKFDMDFILDIRGIFEATEFETLKIHNCKKIDTEAVRKMMPDGKAFVSTVDWSQDISVL